MVFTWPSKLALDLSRRERTLVTVSGTIEEYDPDAQDEDGVHHQILTVRVDEVLSDARRAPVAEGDLLFVSIRYGDSSGLPTEIPGIEPGNTIEVRGAFIPPEDAYPQPDGRQLGVLHFAHRPLGWVKYKGAHYA